MNHIILQNEINKFEVIEEYCLVKKDAKSIRPVNYTINNQKITIEFLKSYL